MFDIFVYAFCRFIKNYFGDLFWLGRRSECVDCSCCLVAFLPYCLLECYLNCSSYALLKTYILLIFIAFCWTLSLSIQECGLLNYGFCTSRKCALFNCGFFFFCLKLKTASFSIFDFYFGFDRTDRYLHGLVNSISILNVG